MPHFGPVSRRDLIAALRRAGFDGPRSSSDHQLMSKDDFDVKLPNPHRGDISVGLLKKVLHQAGISREEWEKL
ncbi:MAG TPA: type II toxin-antitoxin system HicA family toxin [Candidatus Kapabacteria bacterium]|nr:type II toxin-antitoxin system HicA family toxin [Candidatus Kapabacteria bacterium]